MRLTESDYDEYPLDHFPNMVELRVFRDCRVWTAGVEQPLIVLAEDLTRRLAVFEYDSEAERETDIRRILRLPEDGDGPNRASPATLGPVPPTPSAAATAPRATPTTRI